MLLLHPSARGWANSGKAKPQRHPVPLVLVHGRVRALVAARPDHPATPAPILLAAVRVAAAVAPWKSQGHRARLGLLSQRDVTGNTAFAAATSMQIHFVKFVLAECKILYRLSPKAELNSLYYQYGARLEHRLTSKKRWRQRQV